MSAPMRQAIISEVANAYKDQSFLIFFDAKHDIDVPFLENMARLIHSAMQLVVTGPYRSRAVEEAQDAMSVNFSRSLGRFRESVKQLQEIHQQVSSAGPAQPATPSRPEPAARPQPALQPVKAAPAKHGRDSDSDSDSSDEGGASRSKLARKGE